MLSGKLRRKAGDQLAREMLWVRRPSRYIPAEPGEQPREVHVRVAVEPRTRSFRQAQSSMFESSRIDIHQMYLLKSAHESLKIYIVAVTGPEQADRVRSLGHTS